MQGTVRCVLFYQLILFRYWKANFVLFYLFVLLKNFSVIPKWQLYLLKGSISWFFNNSENIVYHEISLCHIDFKSDVLDTLVINFSVSTSIKNSGENSLDDKGEFVREDRWKERRERRMGVKGNAFHELTLVAGPNVSDGFLSFFDLPSSSMYPDSLSYTTGSTSWIQHGVL